MSRIIRTERGTTRRQRILDGMASALRAVGGQADATEAEARDVMAFVALCLREIVSSVEETSAAWEKREYWLKADRFRGEWAWATAILRRLEAALRDEDWARARACAAEVATVLGHRRLRPRDLKARPWRGAWQAWSRKP